MITLIKFKRNLDHFKFKFEYVDEFNKDKMNIKIEVCPQASGVLRIVNYKIDTTVSRYMKPDDVTTIYNVVFREVNEFMRNWKFAKK